MIQEILLWTSSILGLSFLIPYCIPPFRSTLKQIYENKRTNNVFGGDCINDIQQSQIDAIDRTVGQMVASFCQSIIVLWALTNLLFDGALNPLHYFVMSYYIYDIIYLLIKPYGKTQTVFLIHHVLCICVILYTIYIPLGYTSTIHLVYILMELSALSINVSNIQRYLYPASRLTIHVSLTNLLIFFVTRIVVFPSVLLYTLYDMYSVEREDKYIYLFPGSLFTGLLFLCIWWFIGMMEKHKRLERKMIL